MDRRKQSGPIEVSMPKHMSVLYRFQRVEDQNQKSVPRNFKLIAEPETERWKYFHATWAGYLVQKCKCGCSLEISPRLADYHASFPEPRQPSTASLSLLIKWFRSPLPDESQQNCQTPTESTNTCKRRRSGLGMRHPGGFWSCSTR